MKKVSINSKTLITCFRSVDGETIEQRMRRVTENKEPITDGAQPIYTDRKDGIIADYNIRTDRFDVAIEAMDKIAKTKAAIREKMYKKPDKPENEISEAEPIQATE